jgi:hypothetical protein
MLEKEDYCDMDDKKIKKGFYQHHLDKNKIYYFTGEWISNSNLHPIFICSNGIKKIDWGYDRVGELKRISARGVKKIVSDLKEKVLTLEKFLK